MILKMFIIFLAEDFRGTLLNFPESQTWYNGGGHKL